MQHRDIAMADEDRLTGGKVAHAHQRQQPRHPVATAQHQHDLYLRIIDRFVDLRYPRPIGATEALIFCRWIA